MHIRSSHIAILALCSAAMTGCDWGSAGDNTWNDSYAWANFTGTYRFTKAIVTVDTSDSGGESSESSESSSSGLNENTDGVGNGKMETEIKASGQVNARKGIVPKSFTLTVNGNDAIDKDGDGVLYWHDSVVGGVTYKTGKWYINAYVGAPADASISISYNYYTPNVDSGSGSGSGSSSEMSTPSYSLSFLNVTQRGNKLTMTGDSGQVYSGQITGASMGADGYVAAQRVNLSFEVSSAAGAKIVGNFSGNWSGAQNSTYGTLDDRQIHGTLSNGTTFVGTAAPITIHVPDVTVSE